MDTGGDKIVAALRAALNERRKELELMHQAAVLLLSSQDTAASPVEQLIPLIPPAFLFPDRLRARIRIGTAVWESGEFPGTSERLSVRFHGPDGAEGCIEVAYVPRNDEASTPDFLEEEQALLNSVAALLGAWTRHSEDKRRLNDAERRFHALFDSETQCVKVLDCDRRVLDINPAGRCMLGLEPDTPLQLQTLDRFIHADDLAEYQRLHAEALAGKAVRGRYRITAAEGKTYLLETFNVPFRGPDGDMQVLSLTHDLTHLLMQERKFRTLLDASPDAVVIIRLDGVIEVVNLTAERMFGYSRDEMLGKPVEMLLPEHLRAAHVNHRKKYTSQPQMRPMGLGKNLKARARDGREFPVEIALSPVEGLDEDLIFATIRDLSGTREFELALKEMADSVSVYTGAAYLDRLAQFLSTHFGLTLAVVGLIDENVENVSTIAAAHNGGMIPNFEYALQGTPCERVILDDVCIHQDGVQTLFPDDAWFIENDIHAYAGVRLLNEDNEAFGIISAVSRQPLHDPHGIESFLKLAATRAAAELDRMRKTAAIEESEQRYVRAESGTADGLWDLDMRTHTVYYSPRVSELLGIRREQLGNNPEEFWARVHPDDVYAAREARHEHVQRGTPFDVQCRIRHGDGAYRWFRTRGKVTYDTDGKPARFTGSLTDIDEGKRSQLRLKAENAWLAAFAAGVPLHELVNVITATARDLFEDVVFLACCIDESEVLHSASDSNDIRWDPARVRTTLDTAWEDGRLLPRHAREWPFEDPDNAFDRTWLQAVRLPDVTPRVVLAVVYPRGRPEQAHEHAVVTAAARLVRLALDNVRKAGELERQRALFEDLFRNSPEAVAILDKHDRVLDVNPRFTEVFQYALDEVQGHTLNELIVPPEFAREATQLSQTASSGGEVSHETFRARRDGSLLPVSILGAPIRAKGIDAAYFAVYRDQSSLHEAAARLDHQARHDLLTGLPNRYEFERRVKQAISLSRDGSASIGIIYFDLDQFKVVNDTAGHARGDELLQELTQRLRTLIRPPQVLARLGGDEFAILLVNRQAEDCEHLAQRIRDHLTEQPFHIEERTFSITASFGIVAVNAGSDQDPHEILSLADSACFLAKERGRNRVHLIAPDDSGIHQRREEMDWISRINEALLENRFTLYYQRIDPVAESASPKHFEVLLRMLDRDGNNIPPAAFIPPAERYNLMPRIDRWMLANVFSRLAMKSDDEQQALLAAVNISGNTLSDEGLTDYIVNLFQQHAVRPQSICFEITETAAIANFDDARRFINTVRSLGCHVALDDFGSGLSSFRYLKEISPDFLKIDGSFVREITRSRTDFSMVEAINRVGKIIGISTVAEFVEDQDTLDALRRIGVDLAQGYGLHRPEPWL